MLRKSYIPRHKKFLAVAPLVDAVTSEVVVSVSDPSTGETTDRKEFITKVVPQKPTDAIRHEDADLYSIENMLTSGISPVTAPIGGFIHKGLDIYEKVNTISGNVDARMEDIDNMPPVDPAPAPVDPSPIQDSLITK